MSGVKVVVNFADKTGYDVRIGEGTYQSLGARIASEVPEVSAVLIVTDSHVAPLYLDRVRERVRSEGVACREITVPAGEKTKNAQCLAGIWQAMAQLHLDRNCCVLALGGGMVGDLAGFAAATYLRGVSLVQAPTTLLAMVDSSVGGKSAIDLPEGKNLVGAFAQPSYVCADTATLETLPEREWVCGWGEVVKSAVIDSSDFFSWVGKWADALRAHDADAVREAIVRCVVFKAGVVAADERERVGVRECLNYGHTLGHAIETLAGYGTYSHGACVAEGMRFAARLGKAVCGTSEDFIAEQDLLLDTLGLLPLKFTADPDDVLTAMHADKKTRQGLLRFVLPQDAGSWSIKAVEQDLLHEQLVAWMSAK